MTLIFFGYCFNAFMGERCCHTLPPMPTIWPWDHHECSPLGPQSEFLVAFPGGWTTQWHPVDHHLRKIIINHSETTSQFWDPQCFLDHQKHPFETNIDTGKPNPMWSKTPRNPPEPGHPAPPGEQDIESKTPSSNCGYHICLTIAIYFKTSSTPIFGSCMFIGCFPYAHHILVFMLCLLVPRLQAGPMHVCKLLSMLQA